MIYKLLSSDELLQILSHLGTYFTVSPIDLIPTAYKLSKNNIYIIQKYENKYNKKLMPYIPITKVRGFTAIFR